jgi:Xaa-Pro aminopeptidase
MPFAEIQEALREAKLDGWLFFDHHRRDELAYRVLRFEPHGTVTRRWYYFVPAKGEPRGLVHRIEDQVLSPLAGTCKVYSSWGEQREGLRHLLGGALRVAMQYSPNCAIPYVSMVDAGTIEVIRGLGVDVVSSADLIQMFEARWSAEQLEMHLEAGRRVDAVLGDAWKWIGEKLRAGEAITEWDAQQFIRRGFTGQGLWTDHGPIVGVRAHSSDCHYEPERESAWPIKKGDNVLIDLWAKLDKPQAVFYDITWDGYCGETVPSAIQNIFDIVREARDRAVKRVQDATGRGEVLHGFEVDDACRGYIREKGYGDYFVHRTGHSIGSDVHGTGANMDNLETHDERKIIPGTCFSVEPGIYLPEFGVRSEVNVYIEPRGARVTGAIQEKLVLI